MRPDSTERSPTYGASTLVLSRLNWTTGTPDSMMSLSPLAIDSPGTEIASPSAPAATSVLGRGQLGVGVAAGRTGDLDGDAEVLGGELAPRR